MHDGEKLSDFTFVTGGKEWKVHKVVLFMHSDVLYNMASDENLTVSAYTSAIATKC